MTNPRVVIFAAAMLRYVCVFCVVSMALCVDLPTVKLRTGKNMPAIALGTYLGVDQANILKSNEKIVRTAILRAIDIGYRHIDTAAIYETEPEIGGAINQKLKDGALEREELFITTKLWNTHHSREKVPQALRESLQKLGLNYVDLFLMHWPIALNEDYTYSSVDFMETWRGMEDMVTLGLAKSIGVSNFNKEQMIRLLGEAKIKPAVLQIEVHPQMLQTELVSFCQSNDIIVMGYSPLGALVPRFGTTLPGPKLNDPTLLAIAERHGKTAAQVVLRWQVDRKIVPVVKSVNPKRLAENINIFDFKLTDEEISKISVSSKLRLIEPSFWQDHKDYPFEKVAKPVANPFGK